MKTLAVLSILNLTSLFADYHDPVASFHVDATDYKGMPEAHLSFNHQSTFEVEDSTAIILHGLINPYSPKTFHNELGIGFRRLYENFGFGTNIVYAHRNSFGFFNHHIIPGIELFYDHFGLIYNRYVPIKSRVEFEDMKYLFHDVSELSLFYRPSKKYEFSVTPHFNHQTKRVGIRGDISAFVHDNVQLSLTPYFEYNVQKGLKLSVGYHFGGVPKLINHKISKSHDFYFTTDKKEIAKIAAPNPAVLVPSPAPIIIHPPSDENEKPKENKNWWDRIITWRVSEQAASK